MVCARSCEGQGRYLNGQLLSGWKGGPGEGVRGRGRLLVNLLCRVEAEYHVVLVGCCSMARSTTQKEKSGYRAGGGGGGFPHGSSNPTCGKVAQDLRIPAPMQVSAQTNETSPVYERLVEAALNPTKHIPETTTLRVCLASLLQTSCLSLEPHEAYPQRHEYSQYGLHHPAADFMRAAAT